MTNLYMTCATELMSVWCLSRLTLFSSLAVLEFWISCFHKSFQAASGLGTGAAATCWRRVSSNDGCDSWSSQPARKRATSDHGDQSNNRRVPIGTWDRGQRVQTNRFVSHWMSSCKVLLLQTSIYSRVLWIPRWIDGLVKADVPVHVHTALAIGCIMMAEAW